MTTALASRLTDQRGQSLVVFILTITALFSLAAVVVNIGTWFTIRHHAQGVVDESALSSISEMKAGGNDFGDLIQGATDAQTEVADKWPGSTLDRYFTSIPVKEEGQTRFTVQVIAHKQAPFLFSNLLALIGVTDPSFDIPASAVARTEPPLRLAHVSPIALFCDSACMAKVSPNDWRYGWTPDGTTVVDFRFVAEDPNASTFEPVALPGVLTQSDFETYLQCNAEDPGADADPTCNQVEAESSNAAWDTGCPPPSDFPPCWYPHLKFGTTSPENEVILRDALIGAAGSTPRIVAIYDRAEPTPPPNPAWYFHVVGWAAVSFSAEELPLPGTGPDPAVPDIALHATFHKLFLDSSHLSSDGRGGSMYDFGVEALGLSGGGYEP